MDDMTLSKSELRCWLALARAPGLGPATLNGPVLESSSVEQLFAQPPADIPTSLRKFLHQPDWDAADRDLDWLQESGCKLLPLTSPSYPDLLKTIANPPTLLFVLGDVDILNFPQLAIVGSRNPSNLGTQTARAFSKALSQAGLGITSGLALGIDHASHLGALEAGGATIAVTGTGLDRVYPASNRQLAHQISEQGVLISEFPPGTPPKPANFPRRNRIISGLSVGTLVVEAALQSGSLITARTALEQNREVFAIPGSIHNPLARGCHSLIRQGAKLVETADDVLEELSSLLGIPADTPGEEPSLPFSDQNTLDPEYQLLLQAIGHDPVSADGLIEQTGLSAESVSSMLLLLELSGHVSSAPGGHYLRR